MFRNILTYLIQLVWIVSGQSSNSFIGSPLRPFNVNPVFHKLTARIESKVVAGKQLTMWVSLPDSGGEIVKCQWTSPLGVTFIVDRDKLKSIDGKY